MRSVRAAWKCPGSRKSSVCMIRPCRWYRERRREQRQGAATRPPGPSGEPSSPQSMSGVVLGFDRETSGGSGMAMYWKEITVNWGESDPFGLVYYPRIVAWFNDTEHELFRIIGYPIEQMIRNDRTTFVMGEIHFRFIGPAAYGDRIVTTINLAEVGEHTLHWNCKAKNAVSGAPVSEGRATRVYARINEDGSLKAQSIPAEMLSALRELGDLKHLQPARLTVERA